MNKDLESNNIYRKGRQNKKYVLKKDIVIKAGTIFNPAPILTSRDPDHFEAILGLSDDTSGVCTYHIGPEEVKELGDWFEEI